METILIVLDSKKLDNPDLDIRYELPDKVERYANHEICDNGYDYLSNNELGIWFTAKSAKENYSRVIEFFDNHMVCGNDLTGTAKVYISDKEAAPLEECILVYDGEEIIPDEASRLANRVKKAGTIILKIAELVVKDDKSVIEKLAAKIGKYEDIDTKWQCFVEILKEYHYINECEMDLEFDDFMEMLVEMAEVKENSLPVKKEDLNADNDLYQWCEALDEQWEKNDFCMAIFELENGNEVVFPCSIDKLEEIGDLAKEICVRIVAVSEF